MEIYFIAVIILAGLAVSDLIVGVSNDAVNFLNSSIGSRVSPRFIVLSVAGLGMLAGVLFSKGMMEVARKGIFHPKFFTMPELMVIFLAVMLTDVLLLDLYNTFGLPTSTTVSIVFELLGAAVAVSLIKISRADESIGELVKYINTAKALAIISGILLSVVVAFITGAVVQYISRLIFTFDFKQKLKRYGALWGGVALSAIIYFILIKGAKGSTFITTEVLTWIKTNTWLILFYCFVASAVLLQLLIWFTKINILKPIVLIGTFALAMAFAANDLVNFIGVPLAGMSAYQVAGQTAQPLSTTMTALQSQTPSHSSVLLLAGVIMAVTLWFSKKARSVTETSLNLSRQDEGFERFGSTGLSRSVVRMVTTISDGVKVVIPQSLLDKLNTRFQQVKTTSYDTFDGEKPTFDLLRAAVNLMVAGALIAYGTSMKLPLSTTYVTFMVAMGTSFADRAWGRDSAVFRVTGVLAVIGGWFLTALSALTISSIIAVILFYFKAPGTILVMALGALILLRNRKVHKTREKEVRDYEIFNLKKITDGKYATQTTFEHAGMFLREVGANLNQCYTGLAEENRGILKALRRETHKIQQWADILVANVFKTLRLLQREKADSNQKYVSTISSLQEIAECHRDAVLRAYSHVNNHHKGLLKIQLQELEGVKNYLTAMLEKSSQMLMKQKIDNWESIQEDKKQLDLLVETLDKNQVKRIQDESSKTRLSILYYGFIRDARIIADQLILLLEIFQESFKSE